MIRLMLLIFMLTFCFTEARLPGFKARVSKNGISYVNKVALTVLAKELTVLKIPDQSGDSDHLKWKLKNIKNRGMTPPSSNMTLTPGHNGLSWSLAIQTMKLYANWDAEFHEGIIKISDSGSVDVTVKGIRFQVVIQLGADGKERPTVKVVSCSASSSGVDLDFHGGTSFILNLFKSQIEDQVRHVIKDQICSEVKKLVEEDGVNILSKLKVTVTILKKLVLDYGLIQTPTVQTDYLESYHNGEVYWINDTTEAPFHPTAFPPLANDTRMLYLWLSEYTANTFAYVAQKHGFLQYNLSAAQVPAKDRSFFNTTCKLACIGRLISQIGKAYPNALVELRIISISKPNVTIANTGVTCDTLSHIDMFAHTADGKRHYMLTLALSFSMSVEVAIVTEKVTGKIVNHKFNLAVLNSTIGPIDVYFARVLGQGKALDVVLGGALSAFVIPKLNDMAAKGFDLPVIDEVSFENTSVSLLKGFVIVSTDVQYNKTSHPLVFHSEHGPRINY